MYGELDLFMVLFLASLFIIFILGGNNSEL
jgi:hypothetical protein